MGPAAIQVGPVELPADISLPPHATGLVLFAHGSGSSRHSPRNRYVARILNQGGIGTLLTDLLTRQEEFIDQSSGELRFDIPLLGRRLVGITDWIGKEPVLSALRLGLFGASTGAAAALAAAAGRPDAVHAIVSRGGRPDLAGAALKHVRAPSLFIVGGVDLEVLEMNRSALAEMPHGTERKLEIVPGAGHLFEEPGALDQVAAMAREWFLRHLVERDRPTD